MENFTSDLQTTSKEGGDITSQDLGGGDGCNGPPQL